MEEREGIAVEQTANKGKIKPWLLIVIFVIIILIIVGLVFLFTRKTEPEGEQEEAEVACEDIADKRKRRACYSHKELSEDLGETYDEMLETAFKEGDLEFFDETVYERTTNLVMYELCGESLTWLESIETKYGKKLPILDKYALYVSGKEAAQECNNAEKLAYYQGKIDEVFASKEYSEAVNSDDYRVIGWDIPGEDGEYDDEVEEGGENEE